MLVSLISSLLVAVSSGVGAYSSAEAGAPGLAQSYETLCGDREVDQCLEAAYEDVREGQQQQATARFQALCGREYQPGCAEFGLSLLVGRGIASDQARGVFLVQADCDADVGLGCTYAALYHHEGLDGDVDWERALGFYERGCGLFEENACYNLIGMLSGEYGTTLPVRLVEAIGVARESCARDFLPSCDYLGQLLRDAPDELGFGTEFADIYEANCARGYGQSCNSLGFAYAQGIKVLLDDVVAVELYQRACDLGDPVGCTSLGWMIWVGRTASAGDRARALSLFEQGCSGGFERACRFLQTPPE